MYCNEKYEKYIFGDCWKIAEQLGGFLRMYLSLNVLRAMTSLSPQTPCHQRTLHWKSKLS
jgi:hypothetical protein